MNDMSDDQSSKGPTYPCVQWLSTRRAFLKGASVSVAMAPLLSACEFAEVFDQELVASVDFDLADESMAPLATDGGIACIDAGSLELILVRENDSTILAFDRNCPHNQLSMGPCGAGANTTFGEWLPAERELKCNWHGSFFSAEGNALRGPVMGVAADARNIKRYPVEFDATTGLGTISVV